MVEIGQKVKRATNDNIVEIVGIVIEIEGDRARVKWPDKRTWYKLAKLIIVR